MIAASKFGGDMEAGGGALELTEEEQVIKQ